MSQLASTTVSTFIAAPPEAIYRAYLDPQAIADWLPPGDMRGVIHAFEPCEGGAFRMSLIYPDSDDGRGKTSADTDTFDARFAELVVNQRIVWAVHFESADRAFSGEMRVITMLAPEGAGTRVTIVTENIPPGIRPEDNEAGCRLTLEKLAAYVTARRDA